MLIGKLGISLGSAGAALQWESIPWLQVPMAPVALGLEFPEPAFHCSLCWRHLNITHRAHTCCDLGREFPSNAFSSCKWDKGTSIQGELTLSALLSAWAKHMFCFHISARQTMLSPSCSGGSRPFPAPIPRLSPSVPSEHSGSSLGTPGAGTFSSSSSLQELPEKPWPDLTRTHSLSAGNKYWELLESTFPWGGKRSVSIWAQPELPGLSFRRICLQI